MKKKPNKPGFSRRRIFLIVWLALIAVLLIAIVATSGSGGHEESIKEVMRDGVLHEKNKISLFGLPVNPGLISAFTVTGVLLIAAALIRIFAVPRFKTVPGKFQAVIEWMVGFFSDMAEKNAPHKPRFVGAYLFGAGAYVFFGTLFELLGVQVVTTEGLSVSLPAPLSDINGAIAVGVGSFLVILLAGLFTGGIRGLLGVLKDFSLPISMSFRLFGALLSGLLVTELVYYYTLTSFVLPVLVGILFTLLHALIQTFVLTTLVSTFYGEAVEPRQKKHKKNKKKKEEVSL
ncbi:MAG: F0F1 ATP synthase subunit A [Clostridia bacterium]|nr:F0F1 ATP synthase subunit A [Clostridia bacterium]